MLSLVAVAAALWCWPTGRPWRSGALPAGRRIRWSAGLVGPFAGGVGWFTVGPVVGAAAALLGWTLSAMVSGALRDREELRSADATEQAVGALLRELRAGATPEAALRSVLVEYPGSRALAAVLAEEDSPDPVARRLRDSAALSTRLGLPWSGVLAAVADDLRVRSRIRVARTAAMAGPRLSGWVLAALPVVGIGLGYGMGTDPLQVLVDTGPGRVLLLVGVCLTSAGLWWVRRIAR